MKITQSLFYSLFFALLLTPVFAQAQTGGATNQTRNEQPISSEIKTTVDYLGSLIDTMGEGAQDSRFDVDSVYKVQGKELQTRLREKLTQFRASLLSLSRGDFGTNIKLYREEAAEQNRSASAQSERMNGIFQTLADQSPQIAISYQAEIKRLLAIESAWIPVSVEIASERKFRKSKPGGLKIVFANGDQRDLTFDFDLQMREFFDRDDNYSDMMGKRIMSGFASYPKIHLEIYNNLYNHDVRYFEDQIRSAVSQAISLQIKKTIYDACGTSSTCKTNLFADYTNYLQQIKNIVNINLHAKLDEYRTVNVAALPLNQNDPHTIPYDDLFTAIKNFNFESDLSQ